MSLRPPLRHGLPVEPVARWGRAGLWALALALGAWTLADPDRDAAQIVTALGFMLLLAALAARHPDRFRLQSRLRQPDPNRIQLLGPVAVVALGLALRALGSYDVIAGPELLTASLLAMLALGLTLWACIRRASLWMCLALGLVMGAALAVQANGLQLSAARLADQGPIAQKYLAGRRQSPTLLIAGAERTVAVRVDAASYERVPLGSPWCVWVRTGLLGIEVRRIAACA
ncbi:hypothetical protein [Roseateles sp. LYH14W]|uniref:Uncharacterized protein n=1 Tax=Pelomonas parva TaxID=3299032 RepID=A0ABW7F8F9_9BURK